jgi:hypothetical protein
MFEFPNAAYRFRVLEQLAEIGIEADELLELAGVPKHVASPQVGRRNTTYESIVCKLRKAKLLKVFALRAPAFRAMFNVG